MKRLLIILLLFASNLAVFAGPFGLERGMTLKQLKAIDPSIEKIVNNEYAMVKVPKLSSSFREYLVGVHPTEGLLKLVAVGNNLSTNRFGTQLLQEFNKLKDGLSKVYGAPTQVVDQILVKGSSHDDPQDWMYSLLVKERFLGCAWFKKEGPLTSGLNTIEITVVADSLNEGHILLSYYFVGSEVLEEEAF